MNVKKALKEKAKLVKTIAEDFQKVQNYNSIEEGVERVYDPRQSFTDWRFNINKLIDLKVAIHQANYSVLSLIFRLSELKSMTKYIKGLNCDAGKEQVGYGMSERTIQKTAIISVVERDALVKTYELEIESIQEALDEHNFKTNINI